MPDGADHDDEVALPTPTEPTGQLTPIGSFATWLRDVVKRQPSEEEHEAIDDLIPQGGPEFFEYVVRFSLLIVMSAAIAAFGLLANSAAVVIGAMLVAPLMTPITAAAAATVTARNDRLWRALAVVAWGTALAIAVGWVISLIAGGSIVDPRDIPSELEARTFPTLLDLGVAVAAGAAAGYILPRRSTSGALPGVGIAVALVPPLATVGITAELGLSTDARNAFLLFITNLAAIIFSAGVALAVTGFRPNQFGGRRALRTRMAITVLTVALVAIPLSFHTRTTLEDLRLRRAVSEAVTAWDSEVTIVELDADAYDGRASVEILIAGRGDPLPAWQLAEEIQDRFDAAVDLRLLYQRDELYTVSVR
ncbi:MAG TPA: DUF389 domain-containing protein [Ilumatobacteraceae bacterium]|nr:DUF389 domain-containing protein [Ilumatobacteraceae bacterium]